jgi:hypothetical protein
MYVQTSLIISIGRRTIYSSITLLNRGLNEESP